jgi:3-dehydroquinate synthase
MPPEQVQNTELSAQFQPTGILDFLTTLPYSTYMKRDLLVKLPVGKDRTYPILITPGGLRALPGLLKDRWKGRAVFVVTDSNVGPLYGRTMMRGLLLADIDAIIIEVPAGEKSKAIGTYYAVITALLENAVRRGSIVVALGGGVVGDLAGFAAATVLRGVSFVQVPTSLLAQVDSSVGGKTGIDHHLGKNLIGAFHHPSLVLIDPTVLKTLPKREFRSGMAEVIKIAAALDRKFFALLERRARDIRPGNVDLLSTIIRTSAGLKAAVVERDERETGLRKALNLGHTLGHAIETATDFGLKHGEAVALGMVLEGRIAVTLGIFPVRDLLRIRRMLETFGLPTRLPARINMGRLLGSLVLDKKGTGIAPLFVLPKAIGKSVIDVPVPAPLIRSVLA